MKRYTIALILGCLALVSPFCMEAASLEEAAEAMKSGDAEKAVAIYDSIAKAQGVSAELYANLGNAWYESGNTGQAVLNLLRAQRINPANEQIKSNLNFLRTRVLDANKIEVKDKKNLLDPDETTFLDSVKYWIAANNTSNMWACWAAALFVLAMAGGALYFFTDSLLLRKAGFFTAIIALPVCVLTLIFSFMAASAAVSTAEAVVIVPKAELHSQPMKESNPSAAPLHSGSEVKILSRNSDGWVKIEYNSHTEGWTESENISQVVEE